jgi:magnesium-transporting ATPase (P-type)
MLLQCCEQHGKAFLSRTAIGDETWVFHYTPEGKSESLTWKHSHSPVRKQFQTVQWQWWLLFCRVFTVLCWLVGFMALGSTVKAAAYQKTLKSLKEAVRLQGPWCWPQLFFWMTMLHLTVLLQLWISLPPGTRKFYHTHHSPDFHCPTFICSQR